MLSKIYLIGANGNMGQRYQAVMKSLRIPYKTCDVNHDEGIDGCDGVLIATPTYTHEGLIDRYLDKYPVLVEKPIWQLPYNFYTRFEYTNDLWRAKDFRDYSKLRMINQYEALVDDAPRTEQKEVTYYNYFRHGSDGLVWDTINIYGNMADFDRDSLELREDSPVWTCIIDGRKLNIADMDNAYIREIYDWVRNPRGNMQYFCRAHDRAFKLLEQFR
jgi:hypothetical protein